jgi:hypothetical protein
MPGCLSRCSHAGHACSAFSGSGFCGKDLSWSCNTAASCPHQTGVEAAGFGRCVLSAFYCCWTELCFVLSQVVELIWVTVDPRTCIPNPSMTGLAQHLVVQVMALRPRFSVALRKAIAGQKGALKAQRSHLQQQQQQRGCFDSAVCGVGGWNLRFVYMLRQHQQQLQASPGVISMIGAAAAAGSRALLESMAVQGSSTQLVLCFLSCDVAVCRSALCCRSRGEGWWQ